MVSVAVLSLLPWCLLWPIWHLQPNPVLKKNYTVSGLASWWQVEVLYKIIWSISTVSWAVDPCLDSLVNGNSRYLIPNRSIPTWGLRPYPHISHHTPTTDASSQYAWKRNTRPTLYLWPWHHWLLIFLHTGKYCKGGTDIHTPPFWICNINFLIGPQRFPAATSTGA